jgi:hypothetical protein
MKFNISAVTIKDTPHGFRWQIEGFSQDDKKTIFRSVIHHGKLIDFLIPKYKFNEGDSLVVVDKDNAYNIIHEMYESEDTWKALQKETHFIDENVAPFNNRVYMSLPAMVYCTWRGILNTDL